MQDRPTYDELLAAIPDPVQQVGGALGAMLTGVFASSAGFPPGEFRESVAFPIFATAGTDDFNYLEVLNLDRTLRSPHRVVVFEGGHTWLSSDAATEAVEWMELQAMTSGIRPRDRTLIDDMFTTRPFDSRCLTGLKSWRHVRDAKRGMRRSEATPARLFAPGNFIARFASEGASDAE